MKIGLFTDTYRPSVNGVVVVVDIMRHELKAAGHEVFIFCNAEKTLRRGPSLDDHIIRFPSIKKAFFDDYDLSIFFPPRELRRIKEIGLDVIIFFTPSQVGLLGVYAAHKLHIPLISQYSTDLYEYIEHYPIVVPGLVGLAATLPFTIKMDTDDIREWARTFLPKRRLTAWGRQTIERLLTLLHGKCDAVIVLSRKSLRQLKGWDEEGDCRFELIPTGVDPLPLPPPEATERFRQQLGLAPGDRVAMYVGRVSVEKNLDVIIPMMEHIVRAEPRAKFVFVGDFEYREKLEAKAAESEAAGHILFAGKMPRHELGAAYAAAEVFVFPSLKDTQGLVLHEAALAGLPIVMCDPDVSEVVKDGQNGYIVDDTPTELARAVSLIFANPELARRFGQRSRQLAGRFTEAKQAKKVAALIEEVAGARRLPVGG